MRSFALARLASLAGQPTPSGSPQTGTNSVSEPLDDRPTTVLHDNRRRNAIAPLTLKAEAGLNYVIKLVNVADPKDQIMIYVAGGSQYSTKVPLGNYTVRGAYGKKWYGEKDYFGPSTKYFQFKDGTAGEPVVISFSQEGNIVHGATLLLLDGNILQEHTSKDLASLVGWPPPIGSLHTGTNNVSEPLDDRPTTVLHHSRRRNAIAPLTIKTEPGLNYVIKLVNVADPKDQIMIYVAGGNEYSTKVPLGDYAVRGASGRKWYGEEDYFGPSTKFFRFKTRKGGTAGEPVVISFSRQGNILHGSTLLLQATFDGNMSQEDISKADF